MEGIRKEANLTSSSECWEPVMAVDRIEMLSFAWTTLLAIFPSLIDLEGRVREAIESRVEVLESGR